MRWELWTHLETHEMELCNLHSHFTSPKSLVDSVHHITNPEYLFKNGPQFKKSHAGSPKFGLYLVLNCRPFKPLLNYQHGRFWGQFFLLGSPKTTVTAHLCPPCLSTMTRRAYTSRLSFPQWHGLTQTHLPPRSCNTAWHSDITFRKLQLLVY